MTNKCKKCNCEFVLSDKAVFSNDGLVHAECFVRRSLAVEEKLYGYTSKKGLMPKVEPSLSLLIVDFGDSCVVKVEKGEAKLWAIHAFGNLVPENYNHMPIICVPHSFEKVKNTIDAHFAEDKSVRQHERDAMVLVQRLLPAIKSQEDYDALYELARQAGATKPFEIYEPKSGTWEQIYPTGSYNVQMKWMDKENAPIPKVAEVSEYPCRIWRYER